MCVKNTISKWSFIQADEREIYSNLLVFVESEECYPMFQNKKAM